MNSILKEEGIEAVFFGFDALVDKLQLQGKVMVYDSINYIWGYDFFFEDPKDAFWFKLRYCHLLKEDK